ncbi:6-phosphogluconate dehydrogenase [Butyriboletus roseoflavus]|nr:6-phosphogluconate dehydrogenase [Butyriboletus roseoflavus]
MSVPTYVALSSHRPSPSLTSLQLESSGDIGLIGLAVMGQNLILNMNDKGFTVVAYNRTTSKVDDFLAHEAKGTNVQGAHSIQELVAKLKRPRKIILLVKAVDGGNSHYPDSIRRTKELEAKGLLFVGSGVSGGEEGARYGPSLMPGGSPDAWPAIKKIFQATAAQVNGEPCCDWVGETGSGHYVKMRPYDILKRGLGLQEREIAEIFEKWNKGVLDSFLIEITANILKFNDDDGVPLVAKILDQAGQKGTGKWTAIAALDAGTAVTLIGEAVFARCLSAIKEERTRASKVIAGPQKEPFRGDKQQFIDDLEQALYASKIISYTQGFMLMRETAKELNWNLNYAGIARMWRGGCIIKSVFLGDITSAYEKNSQLESLLFDDFFNKAVHKAQPGWRRIIAQAVLWGIPAPAFSTALAFFDGYRSEIVPANLLQAQVRVASVRDATFTNPCCPLKRDYFGAHTFRVLPGKENAKLKKGEDIHINWTGRGGNVSASSYSA